MELLRKHVVLQPTRYAAYVALQVALMKRFIARGGSLEDFCARLAPAYHDRYAASLLTGPHASDSLKHSSARLAQDERAARPSRATSRGGREGAAEAA